MIILRQLKSKLFGIREIQGNDPLPSPLHNPDKNLMNEYGLELEIVETLKYTKGQQKLDSGSRAILKKLRRSIISGLHYYDNGEIENADTHYLSKLTKHPKESHLMSKFLID